MDLVDASAEESQSLAQRILGEAHSAAAARAVPVSARSGAGLESLLAAIDEELPLDKISRARFRIPAAEGALMHLLHERAKVLSSVFRGQRWEVEADVPESVLQRLVRYSVKSHRRQ
jgi:GTP-binding protein HflX